MATLNRHIAHDFILNPISNSLKLLKFIYLCVSVSEIRAKRETKSRRLSNLIRRWFIQINYKSQIETNRLFVIITRYKF